jgi:hypothetical protein
MLLEEIRNRAAASRGELLTLSGMLAVSDFDNSAPIGAVD